MEPYFFDSSALAKCYLVETGTDWARTLLDPDAGNSLYILDLTEVEVTSAIKRRQRAGNLSTADAAIALAAFRENLRKDFQQTTITAALVASAVDLVEKHFLRAHDAIQLAGALEVNRGRVAMGSSPLTVVSADQELNAAAAAEGLAVEDPNRHP